MSKLPLIFIIAGEASGDLLGGDLMKSLKGVRFAGIGGVTMQEQGLQSLFPMEELSIMGVWGILRQLPHLLSRISFTVETIKTLKPDVVITIDAPEFSFRVMKRLHKLKNRPKLIHYVAPTVWAWRPGRARSISKFLDHLLCLYPFEPQYFEKYGLKSTFVGHPIGINSNILTSQRDPHLLCVLPGSRRSEVERLLPIFGETVSRLNPGLKVVIPTLPCLESLVREGTQNWPYAVEIGTDDKFREKAFQNASVALAKSGTVALQLSAARLPFVIAYKVGKLNEWIARALLKTPWACMVNIVLAFQKLGDINKDSKKLIPEPWIPEFIQEDCTPEKMAPALNALLQDEKARTKQIKAMDEVMELIKAKPNSTACQTVIDTLEFAKKCKNAELFALLKERAEKEDDKIAKQILDELAK